MMRTVTMNPSSPLVTPVICQCIQAAARRKQVEKENKRQGPSDLNKGNEIQLTTMKQYREGGGQLVFKW